MLKLSGEALQGKQGFGIDYDVRLCLHTSRHPLSAAATQGCQCRCCNRWPER